MENSAALSLARRWTVSAAHDEDTNQEQRDAAQRGEYDNHPRFAEMLTKATYQLSVSGRHGEADEATLRRGMLGIVQ